MGIGAIILGFSARRSIAAAPSLLRGRYAALAGIVLGAAWCVLAAIIFLGAK
jgi:hypothetical protein